MSNYAAPPQLIESVPYRDMTEMHAFAQAWRDEHCGQWFSVSKLSGFCLLMTRDVYDKIGGLDERFGLGFFDDDDLAVRARQAGFELAVAHDLFIHHFGSRTFLGNGVDAERLLDDNSQRFAAKWGLPGSNGRRVGLRPFVTGPQNGERNAEDDRPQIAQMDADKKQMMASTPLPPSNLSHPCKGGVGGVGSDQSCVAIARRAHPRPGRDQATTTIANGPAAPQTVPIIPSHPICVDLRDLRTKTGGRRHPVHRRKRKPH